MSAKTGAPREPGPSSRLFRMAGLIVGMVIGAWLHAKGYL